jgi:hypothetical protein
MELIMTNQPFNLIFFMAIPVILAESLVITEFYILWRGLLDKIAVMSYLTGAVPNAIGIGTCRQKSQQKLAPTSSFPLVDGIFDIEPCGDDFENDRAAKPA